MRVLVVLVLAGVLAWWLWPGSDGEILGDEAGHAADADESQAPSFTVSGAAAGVALPAELAESLAQAEARWAELAESGDPTIHAEAPALARVFSQALRASYADPGLAALQRRLLSDYCQPLAERLFFSRQPYPDDESGLISRHRVRSGENPRTIAHSYGMSHQFINLLRGRADLEDGSLRVDEQLKVVHARDEGYFIHISKSDYRLDFYIAGVFARRFPVGIGAPATPTPTGRAHIDLREKHTDWTPPDGGPPMPWNHPDNLLGAVWLRLNAGEIGQGGIGIHGFNGEGPATGVQASNGCVRLENEQAELLYNLLVPVGIAPMVVEIVE